MNSPAFWYPAARAITLAAAIITGAFITYTPGRQAIMTFLFGFAIGVHSALGSHANH